MRRVLVLLMLFFGLTIVVIGIIEASEWHRGLPEAHIIAASIFTALCLTHIFLNRKALARYIRGKK